MNRVARLYLFRYVQFAAYFDLLGLRANAGELDAVVVEESLIVAVAALVDFLHAQLFGYANEASGCNVAIAFLWPEVAANEIARGHAQRCKKLHLNFGL